VKSSTPVMWKDMVFLNKTRNGTDIIVNLVNPPKTAIEENPLSWMPTPVMDIEVTARVMDGQAPIAAYLIHAEAPTRGQEQGLYLTQLTLAEGVHGGVSVTVPELLAWKMVVFQYKGKQR